MDLDSVVVADWSSDVVEQSWVPPMECRLFVGNTKEWQQGDKSKSPIKTTNERDT
jgi:hypothetical protein